MQTNDTETRVSWIRCLLLIVSGILIGGGAILPGVSGGVLCVVFGVYRPMMELLAHPKAALPKYWRLLLPVGIGWVLGFLIFAKIIEFVFAKSELLATCLFVGLIAGTVPALYKEAGTHGRTKGSFVSLIVAFVLLFGVLLWVRTSPFAEVTPSWGWFLFCGVLWGVSFIVPGMTSSSILMSLGLLQPLAGGIASFNWSVIVPWAIGMVAIVLALARLVNHLFAKYYSLAYHAVVGIVVASTLIIVPVAYNGIKEVLLAVLCFAVGFAAAYFSGKLEPAMPKQERTAAPEEDARP